MQVADFKHTPVLLNPVIEGLNIKPDGIYLDGTLGRAGHAREILKRLNQDGKLIGVDRDPEAIRAAREILKPWEAQVILKRGNFADLDAILRQVYCDLDLNLDLDLNIKNNLNNFNLNLKNSDDNKNKRGLDGMLFDLGVSSPQLDDPARGFSYARNAPLDMRMDPAQDFNARDLINNWNESDLKRIFYQYGEERYANLIAREIIKYREKKNIETTGELADIIKSSMPSKALREKQHPAKRVFQAIRIAVNGELDALEPMIKSAVKNLKPGGRLAIITFHSLEDKIIKNLMRDFSKGCTCPPDFPVCVCGKKPVFKIITRKPITPDELELQNNPRARSAKLRIAEKL